jgi:exonuclease VII large subunit
VKNRFRFDRFNQRIEREQSQLEKWTNLYRRRFETELAVRVKEISFFRSRLNLGTILKVLERERRAISAKLSTVRAFDPANSLKRGFSLVYNNQGDLIKSVALVKKRDNLNITVTDGHIITTVNDIEGD